ncbi:hypothetical protein ACFYMI_26205 [Streptomyces collinus]|uniref:hypothetical protein n=1 Tax=Streptomyces collinus TaxID=42684 RepID=UPI0036B4BEDF
METEPATVESAASDAVPTSRTGARSAGARAAVEEGLPAETRGYAGDWQRFTAWCAGTGRQALPATGDTLTEYMSCLRGEDKSPATMDRALASFTVAHAAAGVHKPSAIGVRRVSRATRPNAKMARTGAACHPGRAPLPRPCSAG